MRFRNLLILSIIAVLTLVVAACGTAGGDAPADAPPAAAETPATPAETPADDTAGEVATVGDGREVVWVSMSESPTMDPIVENDSATSDIVSQMAEGLMWFNPANNVLEPLLAESVNIIDDEGVVYQFNLRRGVYFHDGTPFTAEAVVISLNRLLDSDSPGRFILEMITDVEAIDDHTVNVTIEFPFSPFLAHLTHMVGFIFSPTALASGTPIAENPVGTGPFMLGYRDHGNYTRLVPNPNHWRAVPQHDVLFRVIPDTATRLAMLDVGEAHAMTALASDVHQLYGMTHVNWWRVPTTSLTYIGFNTAADHPVRGTDNPLADARVRRAITMAINAEDILYGVQEGEGVLAVGPVRGGLVAHAPAGVQGLPFDPDAARELLAEAGFPDGFSTTIWTNYGNAVRARICELVQANLAVIGVDLDIQIIEWAQYLTDTAAGLHDMFLLGWVTMTGDADYGILPLLHSSEIGGGNRTHFSNPAIDALLDEARVATDGATRDRLYHEVVEMLVYEAPMIFLFHPDTPAVTNGIDGLMFDFTVTPFFFNTTLQ